MTELPWEVKVRASRELLETLFTRDADCNRLSVDWGESDTEGCYAPTITRHTEDNPLTAAYAMNERQAKTIADLTLELEAIRARTNTVPEWLSQALNEGDGVYRP